MSHVHFAGLVDFCIRRAWLILLASAIIVAVAGDYVARHFAVNSDISDLLSPELPWRKRELAYQSEFPQQANSIIAVVNAPTPEFAGAATAALVDRLAPQKNLFHAVSAPQGGEFFARNGLLYLSPDDLAARMNGLSQSAPLVRTLVADPSLRGLTRALSMTLQGMRTGRYDLNAMARPLNTVAETIEGVLAARPATFSWQVLLNGAPAKPEDLRQIVTLWPVLDFAAVEPGAAAIDAVRATATDAKLSSDYNAAVKLTGPVPLADAQFAALQQGVWLNAIITAAIVLVVLWLALRSARIVAAVVVTIFVGLVATAALGLLLVGAFNPISLAFAMLFVGLGADFAIQFSVRYRAQRHDIPDLKESLTSAASYVGPPLTLAALAAAAGFLSFVPTSYRGVAELGLIAGVGMVVAYVASMTLLPALLALFKPSAEPAALGYAAPWPAPTASCSGTASPSWW